MKDVLFLHDNLHFSALESDRNPIINRLKANLGVKEHLEEDPDHDPDALPDRIDEFQDQIDAKEVLSQEIEQA